MTVDVHRAAEPAPQPEAEVAQAGPSEGKLCLHLV